jgi:spore coat protein A
MLLDRRKLLKSLAALGAGSTLLKSGSTLAGRGGMGGMGGGGGGGGGGTPTSGTPLPIPQEITPSNGVYEIVQREADVEIVPGTTTRIWGYNGTTPGPLIRAQAGQSTTVRITNQLSVATSTHLHGAHVEPSSDGYPTDLVQPGTSRDYVYSNKQLPATLWYHDHAMHETAINVYMGLAGFYIIEDSYEQGLNLPSGEFEIAMAIQDRTFNSDGSLSYGGSINGEYGDTLLVNGAIQPVHEVGTRKYRYRILNGSNARRYELALSNNDAFIQIGTDGGLLSAPLQRSTITLSPAERADVVIDFSNVPVGTQVVLENLLETSTNLGQVMTFNVANVVSDDSDVPSVLRPVEYLNESDAVVTRNFTLSRQGRRGPWVIDGNTFDPNRVDAYPQLNTTEIWEFSNMSNMDHPMHMHDVMFQVLSVGGGMMGGSGSALDGWKDTVNVPPMGTARVIMRFEDYRGKYVFHCHVLEHEDYDMMSQFEVV